MDIRRLFRYRFLYLVLSCVAVVRVSAAEHEQRVSIGEALGQHLVWSPSAPPHQQVYAVFRRCFDLQHPPTSAQLYVFADSRFVVWVNGILVGRGPNRFDPREAKYSAFSAEPFLRAGTNAVAVLVHHYHDGRAQDDPEPMNGRIMRSEPACAVLLDCTNTVSGSTSIWTDEKWRVSTQTRYRPSPISWGWIPDRIDARLDQGDWTRHGFDDSTWESAKPVKPDTWETIGQDDIPRLQETEVIPDRILGDAAGPLKDALPLTLAPGQRLLIDVGRSVLAYEVLDFDATDGAEIEVVHGHGFRDGALDETYDANQYIARAGRQSYTSGDTCGFRYMDIRVHSGQAMFTGIRVVNRVYPFQTVGQFACNDTFLNTLWQRSVRTVQLCSEDGYTDCTARERTEWMGDAALIEYPLTRVAFAGPTATQQPAYSDPLLIRVLLRHIALSQQPDGRVKAHHPSNRWDIHGFIEDYACLWIRTIDQYFDNTHDLDFVKWVWPKVSRQADWFLEQRAASGLVRGREFIFFDNPLSYKVCEGTTLNASVVGALRHAARLAMLVDEASKAVEYSGAAAVIAARINEALWDNGTQTYCGGLLEGTPAAPTAHAAMIALYYGIVPKDRREPVLRFLTGHLDQIASPFNHAYLFDVLYRANNQELDQLCLELMRKRWASTLARTDLDTVFEGFGGPSLCHNAGASAAYFLSAYVLGVRREGPLSNNTILVDPRPGDLTQAEGAVVTELGAVPVAWERSEGQFHLTVAIPPGVTAKVLLPAANPDRVQVSQTAPPETSPKFIGIENGKCAYMVGSGAQEFRTVN